MLLHFNKQYNSIYYKSADPIIITIYTEENGINTPLLPWSVEMGKG